jgi:hypothetical protein
VVKTANLLTISRQERDDTRMDSTYDDFPQVVAALRITAILTPSGRAIPGAALLFGISVA